MNFRCNFWYQRLFQVVVNTNEMSAELWAGCEAAATEAAQCWPRLMSGQPPLTWPPPASLETQHWRGQHRGKAPTVSAGYSDIMTWHKLYIHSYIPVPVVNVQTDRMMSDIYWLHKQIVWRCIVIDRKESRDSCPSRPCLKKLGDAFCLWTFTYKWHFINTNSLTSPTLIIINTTHYFWASFLPIF